jgi:hypothetical protein
LEAHLTPEQQTQLAQIAVRVWTNPERLAATVVASYLDDVAANLAG